MRPATDRVEPGGTAATEGGAEGGGFGHYGRWLEAACKAAAIAGALHDGARALIQQHDR